MPEQATPRQEDINTTTERATESMQKYAERGGIGAERRAQAQKKLGEITALVVASPDRVAHDVSEPIAGKPFDIVPGAHTGTEYDVDRAKHMADTVKPYVDARAKAKAKGDTEAVIRYDMAIANLERNAGETYDEMPFDVGPNIAKQTAEQYRQSNKVLRRGLFGDRVKI